MTTRGEQLGYVHKPPTLAERLGSGLRSLRVANGFIPTRHSGLDAFAGDPWKQWVGACTGFALAKLVQTVALANGIECPELSAFFPYYFARARAGNENGPDGAHVDDLQVVWNKLGTCPEAQWRSHSLDRSGQRERRYLKPPMGVVLLAKQRRKKLPIRVNRIVATGERLFERILHSLNKFQGVLLAGDVGDEMRDGRGLLRQQTNATEQHLFIVLDWEVVDGEIALLCINSWGSEYGDNGRFWVSEEYVAENGLSAWYVEVAR